MVLISDTDTLVSRKMKIPATTTTAASTTAIPCNSSNATDKKFTPKPIDDDDADDAANTVDNATIASNDVTVDGFKDTNNSKNINNNNNKLYVNHKNVFRDNCKNYLSFSAPAATNVKKQFSYYLGTILMCLFSKSLTMNILPMNSRMFWKIQNKNKNVNNIYRNNISKHNKEIIRPATMLAIILVLCSGAAMARPNGGGSDDTFVTTSADDVSITSHFLFLTLLNF